jgi:hypothetical protein
MAYVAQEVVSESIYVFGFNSSANESFFFPTLHGAMILKS